MSPIELENHLLDAHHYAVELIQTLDAIALRELHHAEHSGVNLHHHDHTGAA